MSQPGSGHTASAGRFHSYSGVDQGAPTISVIAGRTRLSVSGSTVVPVDAVDLATVIGGWASPAAILLAVGTWRVTRSDEQRAAARLVTTKLAFAGSSNKHPIVQVRNDSAEPISQVWVTIPGDSTSVHRVSLIASGSAADLTVVPSRTQGPPWAIQFVGCGGPAAPTEPVCELRFVDARGKAWMRTGLERPRRAQLPPDAPSASRSRKIIFRLLGR